MSDSIRNFAGGLVATESLTTVKEFCLANAKNLALAAASTAALVYTIRACYRASKLPPGPMGLPVIGRLPWLDINHLEESHEKMRQNYGDIYSYRFGNRLVIVVSSRQFFKEMFDDDAFSGRLVTQLLMEKSHGCGIAFAEGRSWSEQRRVTLRVLRDFGFAKQESVNLINEEISLVMEQLDNSPKGVKTIDLFAGLTNSVISMMIFGRRCESKDKRYAEFMKNIKYIVDVGIINSLPFLFPYLAWLLRFMPSVEKFSNAIQYILDFVQEEVEQREALMSSDVDAESTCLVDAYVKERRRAEAKGDKETFCKYQLIWVSTDLFAAGTDTTAKSLEWLIIYMSAFPNIQTKVREEIHRIVGTERRPQISDRSELNYTQAVIDESMRFSSLVPNSVSHRAIAETYFHGRLIPNDAVIVPFIYGLHRDTKSWRHPYVFYPEHFLTEEGKYAPSNMLVPFNIGKRSCLGENLAKLEIFLTFTAIAQQYRFQFAKEFEAKTEAILRGTCGLQRNAGDNRIDFVRL